MADAFTQALAAMMGVTAPAGVIAHQTPTTGAASQSVGASTLGAKNAQLPAIGQLAAGDAAATEAALKDAAGQTAPALPKNAQASANVAAGKAQADQAQADQAQGAPAAARQAPASPLTAFGVTKLGANATNGSPPANDPPAEPTPPLNAQSATVAILTAPVLTAPVQTPASKLASEPAEKTQAKADANEDSPATPASAAPKPQAPTPAADTASGEGEADLGGHRPSEFGPTSQTLAAQTPSSTDNTSFASALNQTAAPAQTAAPSATLAAAAGAAIAGQIATQTIKSLNSSSTRFDIALEPAGLGQVNVKIQIDQTGQVSAAFSFDNAHAAAAAKSQAGQLQQALEQAGFNVGHGGLSFDVGGQGAGGAHPDAGQNFASGGGGAVLESTSVAAAPSPTSNPRVRASGVDITV